MNTQDLTITLLVDKSPTEVYDAINNVRRWWGEGIEGGSDKLNDEFIYRHKDLHYSKQKLTELIPGKKVVWLVTDSVLYFLKKNKEEWIGTHVVFDISTQGDKTQVLFTHYGLVPEVECFEACSGGWNYYVGQSLLSLITTGEGRPDKKENHSKAQSKSPARGRRLSVN